ncbi:Dihydrolipoyllysine-residue acetyltransferase component of acetoin cleaving system [Candidatus Entotheonellaceae bacterium PAL068K]
MHSPRLVGSSATAYLESNGLKLRYTAAGDGEPVLLLHGWGCTIDSMGLIFNDLVPHYTVVALDFPGHGESDLPPKAWGVSDYAALVLRVMDALGLRRPHIIAHSHGGRVSIKLAATHPDRVDKLVLVNSAGIRPPRPRTYYARALLASIGKGFARYCGRVGERTRTLIYRAIASTDYANAGPLRDTFVKLVNEDLTPLLPHIAASTLLLWGEDDTETPVASAMIMQRLIPHAELIILKHAGHFSYIDQFGKFRLVVRKFLRQ